MGLSLGQHLTACGLCAQGGAQLGKGQYSPLVRTDSPSERGPGGSSTVARPQPCLSRHTLPVLDGWEDGWTDWKSLIARGCGCWHLHHPEHRQSCSSCGSPGCLPFLAPIPSHPTPTWGAACAAPGVDAGPSTGRARQSQSHPDDDLKLQSKLRAKSETWPESWPASMCS
jgi:hypothetical protein